MGRHGLCLNLIKLDISTMPAFSRTSMIIGGFSCSLQNDERLQPSQSLNFLLVLSFGNKLTI